MLVRNLWILLTLSMFLPVMSPMNANDDTKPKLRTVRMIYLVSSDRTEKAEYTAALEHAIRDLQKWYGRQLGGPTFRLSDPVVEVVECNREAAWFYKNANGNDPDSWGFNNTLDEAKHLVGAKHNDPDYVWILYSDGAGNRGRGGSGVACLPEDDLLGLVGKHPEQKDKSRWIAGLGHELGHAFGLPHPADTEKYADAIMWLGIYGKYPDHTYLTDDDKKILRRSPFFYRENDDPLFQLGKIVARYTYPGGAFEQHDGTDPVYWTESKTSSTETPLFEETRRNADFIFLRDDSRGFAIRLPVDGGRSSLSVNKEESWQPLYAVELQK